MKPIKVCQQNLSALNAALLAVNGKATAHTLTDAEDLLRIASNTEGCLVRLVGAKKRAPGATMTYISGDAMPAAYKYSRAATHLELERRSSDWFLINASATAIYNDGGKAQLTLTPAQDAAAIATLRKEYIVRT